MNILSIIVTPEVSHGVMSSSKDAAAELQRGPSHSCAQNKSDMSVTPLVSQRLMGPYVAVAAVAFASHASTASRMLASSALKATQICKFWYVRKLRRYF